MHVFFSLLPMEKKPITEINAVAAVMDSIFQQVDNHWFEIWSPVERGLENAQMDIPNAEFVKFNYSLAVLAVNFRAAFDLFPRPQAERFFTHMQNLLLQQLGQSRSSQAVLGTVVKFTEAYNNGILRIKNPLHEVAMLLYFKIGLQNTEQKVVDEKYYVPEPEMVDYLERSLLLFAGKWDLIRNRYEVTLPA